jgi:hypothetical protein
MHEYISNYETCLRVRTMTQKTLKFGLEENVNVSRRRPCVGTSQCTIVLLVISNPVSD